MKKILFVLLILLFVVSTNANAQPLRTVFQHGFDITPQTKTRTNLSGVNTDTVLWTPASGKKIVLMGVSYWADAISRFYVKSGSTMVIPTSGNDIASGIVVISGAYPIWKGAADATLTYTTPISNEHTILLWGYEE